MDIRGVEITNQLRSAIRAKLIELGVRYDEELPDYILVMVVNKKSRQQMNEDLNLFLEDSTELFVDWLHDQVLKKLQKVTVAKKKNNKEIAPSVNIKKEEEQSKVKVEDQKDNVPSKSEPGTKQDRDREFEELVGDLALLNEDDHSRGSETTEDKLQKRSSAHLNDTEKTETCIKRTELIPTNEICLQISNLENQSTFSGEISQSDLSLEKPIEYSPQNSKRASNVLENISNEDNSQIPKRKRLSNYSDSEDDRDKSNMHKPKITSIVSVKTKFGAASPSKKQEPHSKSGSDSRNISEWHSESRKNESNNTHYSSSQGRSSDRRRSQNEDSRSERHRSNKSQYSENLKKDRSDKSTDLRDRVRSNDKPSTIKSRLGNNDIHKQDKIPLKPSSCSRISKPRVSSVRSRLGVRNKPFGKESFNPATNSTTTHGIQNYVEEDDDTESTVNTSLKSQIIAVPKSTSQSLQQNRSHSLKKNANKTEESESKNEANDDGDDVDDGVDQCKIPSKVIVTPRPLKPLEAVQKHATKSLLLKAVAEANKSVVLQKKVDPCLKVQKSPSKITVKRDARAGKILSVHLNSKKKKMVMENIQVELHNKHSKSPGTSGSSKIVSDEDFNVVKSLFNRSSDRQKFLVTLNGYNNNIFENQNSDNEEQIDMEVKEDEELSATYDHYEPYNESDHMINDESFEQHDDQFYDYYENQGNEQNELLNQSTGSDENNPYQNFKSEDHSSRKKRKLSPIVYNRSRSSSPNDKSMVSSLLESAIYTHKRPVVSSVITTLPDRSGEKCRYWPNCTLGIKCSYFHPEVSCSSFPACKFGDKCAYKHPKCKFGSACTKLNCIFSHPPMQCKYHPYCMKPGCPFSHPKSSTSSISSILSPLTPLTPDLSSVRAKFTWKKKD